MEKRRFIIISVVVLIIILLFVVFFLNSENKEMECNRLAGNFDKEAADGSLFPQLDLEESEVGGTLISIEFLEGYKSMAEDLEGYKLYFKGIDEEASLLLTTTVGNVLPYQENSFYKFDLNDIRFSGAHSGEFVDRDLDKLILISC